MKYLLINATHNDGRRTEATIWGDMDSVRRNSGTYEILSTDGTEIILLEASNLNFVSIKEVNQPQKEESWYTGQKLR